MLANSTYWRREKINSYQTGRSKATVVRAGLNYFPLAFMSRLVNVLRIISMVIAGTLLVSVWTRVALLASCFHVLIVAAPTIFSFIVYWRNVQFRWSTPIGHLIFAFFGGVFIAPVAAFVQYILLYGLQNHSVNLEESLAFDEVTLSTIASHILLSLFLSFVVAAFFEETCKRLMVDSWTSFNLSYLKFHQNEKKYYQNNHQYNVRNVTYGANATPITSQQDPLQTLLIFHFVGLGFSVFENSYSTLYIKLSKPTSTDYVGIQALKITMHHSMYISTLHCVCCALTASQIFRRDFYGGYELINRGRHLLGYLHILAPSILLHGSFDLIAFLVKMHIQYAFGNNTASADTEQFVSIVIQTVLLLGSILYVENVLGKLNIYELSYAVRDLDNMSVVSIV